MALPIILAGILFGFDALQAFAAGPVDHHAAGQSFRDCPVSCPEMVVLPPGKFTMGSSISERGRGSDENPQQQVTIAYALAVGKYPCDARRVRGVRPDTRRTVGPCEHWEGSSFRIKEGIYWNDVFQQTDRHPVVCVNWDDARAYVRCRGKRGRAIAY